MLTPKTIRKSLEEIVWTHLQPRGFAIRRGFLIRERTPEIFDWIALPHSVPDKNGPAYFTANIGIHVRPLHQLLERVGNELSGYVPATFVVNVGYLTPDKRWIKWPFPRTEFSRTTAEALSQHIIQFGLPFQESFVNLKQVYAGCERHGIKEYNRLRLPILGLLMGQKAQTIGALQQLLEEYRDVENAYAPHLRRSVGMLLEYLRTGAT